MTLFLAEHCLGYATSAIRDFPHHLASAVFCLVFIVMMILGIIKEKKAKILAWVLVAGFMAVVIVLDVINTKTEQTVSFPSSSEITLDSTSEVISATNISEVRIEKLDEDYHIMGNVYEDSEAEVTISTGG
ncbi:MAG: hypothetical protein IJ129_05395, partial [Ruminococcus sp.]|nr:hypothetical protein [Ruminococcus sp.]